MIRGRKAPSVARAGLPLARAQRLHAQTARIGRFSALRTTAVSLVAIGAVVVFGAFPAASARVQSVILAASNGTPLAQLAGDLVQPLPQDAPTEVASAEPVVTEDIAPEAILFDANADAPACIVGIEQALADMVSRADASWSDNQETIDAIVQRGVDCPQAGVRIAGSLELAQTGFADLRLQWDRATWVINLTTVDPTLSSPDDIIVTDRSLEIVFR